MQLEFITVDVFTEQPFGGNPLAVILDGRGVTTAQMQAIAAEFNLAETTFVLPPQDPSHTAQVRIFTPRAEMPFAGHPNVGTAFRPGARGRTATADPSASRSSSRRRPASSASISSKTALPWSAHALPRRNR